MLTDRSRKARPLSRLALCSSLAIATALVAGPGAARAQSFTESFQGSSTVVSGGATVSTGTNTTTIDIDGTNADVVIDWNPFDTTTGTTTPINFQPAGTTATFQSTNGNFTVLNRILPTDPGRAVQFNGTVIAQLIGASSTPAGTVYFYSPGGIIVGATAVFNVGNLGLTSAAPVVDVNGCFDCGSSVTFSPANPGTGVDIQAGAQITGTGGFNGTYLAVVAPRVSNAGTITGKRAVALVSADAATLTFNVNGLFDIQVDSGTSATGTTLFNSGSITGPAGDSGTASRIYLVAVPKNQAISMAIAAGSTLGFDIADAADVVGNAVVLSGGSDVFGGTISSGRSGGAGTGSTTIDVNSATFTSDVQARSDGNIAIGAIGGATSFAAGLTAHSDTDVGVFADGVNGNLAIAGDVLLDSDRFSSGQGQAATGGNVTIGVSNGATISIGGAATLNARGFGGSSFASGTNGGAGTGGMAQIGSFQGGSLTIGGALTLDAGGFAGSANTTGSTGGVGTGGIAQIYHDQAGSIVLNGGATLYDGWY